MNAPTIAEQEVDFSTPDQSEVATLNDMKAADTVRISLPQPEAQPMYAAEKIVSLSERIAMARVQTGIKVVELFHVSEITELTATLSGEELQSAHWKIRTNDAATKRVLRSTLLSFENTKKTEQPTHDVLPRAVKGNIAELEDRVSRLRPGEKLRVRLPEPGNTATSWKALADLQERTGNRVEFIPHAKYASVDYENMPIHVEKSTAERLAEQTTEHPNLKIVDPHAKKGTFFGRALGGVTSFARNLWGNMKLGLGRNAPSTPRQ